VQGELLLADVPETIERLLRQEQVGAAGGAGCSSPVSAQC
jgi:hypothetical protein